MKKMAFVAALVAAAVLLVSCGATEETAAAVEVTPAVEEAAEPGLPEGALFAGDCKLGKYVLANNHQYGKNYQFQNTTGAVLPKDYKAQAGDKIQIHIEGTWSADIITGDGDDGKTLSLLCWIVDCSPAASYWTPLTEMWTTDVAIKAGEPWTFDATFEITKDAVSKAGGSRGADVTFATSNNQAEASTLEPTAFSYVIYR